MLSQLEFLRARDLCMTCFSPGIVGIYLKLKY